VHAGRASALLFQLCGGVYAGLACTHWHCTACPCSRTRAVEAHRKRDRSSLAGNNNHHNCPPLSSIPCLRPDQAYPGSLHRAVVVTSRVCTTSAAKPATLVSLFLLHSLSSQPASQPGRLWTTDDVGTARDTYETHTSRPPPTLTNTRRLLLLPPPRDIRIALGPVTGIQNPQSRSPPVDTSRLSAHLAPCPLQHAMSPPRMLPPCKPQATTSGCNHASSTNNNTLT
jgi:hypothetical protein